MGTTRLRRKARKQGEDLRSRTQEGARELGGRIGATGRQVGATVGSTAKDVGSKVGAGARDVGGRLGERTKDTRRKVGYWIAGEKPPGPGRYVLLAGIAGAAGAAASFFLDPVSGKRRRSVARDRIAAAARAAGRGTGSLRRGVGARAYGLRQRVSHRGEARWPESDAVLAHKVESEVFQGLAIPSGRINVNAENGVVVLRGTVESPDQITEVERRTRDVNGVRDVENLLHLAGTSAPTR